MDNSELAQIFREIAIYLEMQGVQFKPRAYEKVAYVLEALEESVDEIYKRGGIRTAKETGTILDIDAYPERLDLKDEHIRRAVPFNLRVGYLCGNNGKPTNVPDLRLFAYAPILQGESSSFIEPVKIEA